MDGLVYPNIVGNGEEGGFVHSSLINSINVLEKGFSY
jgi:hypothetical protein